MEDWQKLGFRIGKEALQKQEIRIRGTYGWMTIAERVELFKLIGSHPGMPELLDQIAEL